MLSSIGFFVCYYFFEKESSVALGEICPAVHYSPNEKLGAVISIGFTLKGSNPWQPTTPHSSKKLGKINGIVAASFFNLVFNEVKVN